MRAVMGVIPSANSISPSPKSFFRSHSFCAASLFFSSHVIIRIQYRFCCFSINQFPCCSPDSQQLEESVARKVDSFPLRLHAETRTPLRRSRTLEPQQLRGSIRSDGDLMGTAMEKFGIHSKQRSGRCCLSKQVRQSAGSCAKEFCCCAVSVDTRQQPTTTSLHLVFTYAHLCLISCFLTRDKSRSNIFMTKADAGQIGLATATAGVDGAHDVCTYVCLKKTRRTHQIKRYGKP